MISCFDCKHHKFVDQKYNYSYGGHTCFKYPDAIGKYVQSCYEVRGNNKQCGEDGIGFEEKEPELIKISLFDKITLAFARFRNGY